MSNNRGSSWIKCDLHVHTPASFFHLYGDRNNPTIWEQFFSDLEALPPEFKIIGINDYLTIEGYKRVIQEKAGGRLENIDCILPVIEFRLNRLVGEGQTKRLNYHVIFSSDLDPALIESQFLQALSARYTLETGEKHPTWNGIISEQSFQELGRQVKAQSLSNTTLQAKSDWDVGFDNFNIDYDKLKEILNFTPFRGKVITAIGKNEWESYRWDGGGAADKRTIINETDIVFLAAESPVHHEKSRQSLTGASVNALLLDCSDAHNFANSTQKDRIGNCFTWVKAEPTFEGLKQILFEPENRISISETHPDKKAPYQVIKSARFINAGDVFTDKPIEFSTYLNSIVGGKSTGKSLLAGLIVKSSDLIEYDRRSPMKSQGGKIDPLAWVDTLLPNLDFEVTWNDGVVTRLRDDEARKVTYFPQHYLNSSISDHGGSNKELNKIIRVVLAQNEHYNASFDTYRSSLKTLDAEVAAAGTGFENSLRDLREARHRTGEKGKSEDVKANIEKLEGEFKELKKKFDLTEEEIKLHADLTQKLTILSNEKGNLENDIRILDTLTSESITNAVNSLPLFSGLIENASKELSTQISSIIFPLATDLASKANLAFILLRENRSTRIAAIETEIANHNAALQPILDKISNSAPLKQMSATLEIEKKKLAGVLELEAEMAQLKQNITSAANMLNQFIDRRLELAAIVMAVMEQHPISRGDDQLDIEIQPHVKAEHIQTLMKDRFKYQSNPVIKTFIQEAELNDTDVDGYKQRVATVVQQAMDEKLEFKSEYNLTGVLQELLTNAMYLNYDLKLSGDSFSIMSPGKRALALLRIIVELDTSQHPIILDQPEDDLDNRSIYDGLATYLKNKKQLRQIIVVTHNPNVVVGADSEYVIVANQTGQESNQNNRDFRFEYIFGGLENSFRDDHNQWILEKQGIKEHVCDILDGGEEAFLRREKLYSTLKA